MVEAKKDHDTPKLIRLGSKTEAKSTEYSNTKLVSSQELKRMNSIKQEEAKNGSEQIQRRPGTGCCNDKATP